MHSSRMRSAHLLTVSQHALIGGCTFPGGVPAWGVPARGGETYLSGGVSAQGVYLPWGCTCPGSPPCEQNDRQVQKYYLAPNFVCGR